MLTLLVSIKNSAGIVAGAGRGWDWREAALGGALPLIGGQASETCMLQTSMNETRRPDPVGQPLTDILSYLIEVVRLDGGGSDDQLAGDRRVVLRQDELDALPGITCDTHDEDGAVWLAVEQLKDIGPPTPDADLRNWIEVSRDPEQRPRVRDSVVITVDGAEKERLVAAEQARSEDCTAAVMGTEGTGGIWNVRLRLAEHPNLAGKLEQYIAEPWTSWAEAERPRRKTMAIHRRLMDLVDLTQMAGRDRAVELVWGIAVSRNQDVEQPVLERLVEIEVMEDLNGEVRIRPRLVEGAVNLSVLGPCSPRPAGATHDAGSRAPEAIECIGEISPFVRKSYEPILNQMGLQLDSPPVNAAESDALVAQAKPLEFGQKPVVSDRWMIFARPRSNSLALRDIERLKEVFDRRSEKERWHMSMMRLLALGLPEEGRGGGRRGLPGIIGRPIDIAPGASEDVGNHDSLFFPLAFDNDQIEIVRRLEQTDGLVVESGASAATIPAIVNVVCHYLALGQRVLVVSPEATGLAELRQRLPLAIRDLAIGPTGSDKERARQIATAIRRLQSMAETLRPHDQMALIDELEREVVATQRRVGAIDEEVANIARVNLRRLPGSADPPFDIAKKLVTEPDAYAWFEDRPEAFLAETDLSVEVVEAVRDARMRVARELSHIDDEIPALAELPLPERLVGLHADLRRAAAASPIESVEGQLAHKAIATLGVESANNLAADLESLSAAHQLIADEPWIAPLSSLGERLRTSVVDVTVIVDLARDASFQSSRYATFSARPVEAPTDAFLNKQLIAAIDRLANGKSMFKPFALRNSNLKAVVKAITVAGMAPSSPGDWRHVRDYLMWRRDIHALNARWMSLVVELGGASAEAEFPQTLLNLKRIETCVELAVVAPAIAGRNVAMVASSKLGMSRAEIDAMLLDGQRLHALGTTLKAAATGLEASRRELTRLKELFSGASALAASIRNEVLSRVGREQVAPDQLRVDWLKVHEQIGSLCARRDDFVLINTVSKAIAEMGAPRLAHRIRTEPVNSTTDDQVLPPDWALAWDRAVLTRQLEAAGQRPRLRSLGDQRQELESKLHQLFEAIVAARTHLALAQTMTEPIKQALADFVITLQRTGLSARDAIGSRKITPETLEHCYRGIPCWITQSRQLCEQLPTQQIGAFDLVIIQEASNCDVRDLTALLRGRKVLVVSGETASLPVASFENAAVDELEKRFLRSVPKTVRAFLSPGSSLYDLTSVMFAEKLIKLKDAARHVAAIPILPARYGDPSDVHPVSASGEQSDQAIDDTHVVGGRREAREANIVVGQSADPPTTVSAVATARTDQLASVEAISATASPDSGPIDAAPTASEDDAGIGADVAIFPLARPEPATSGWRDPGLMESRELRPKANWLDESPEGFGDRAPGGEALEEPGVPPSRPARASKPTIRRSDAAADADAPGRPSAHAREEVTRPRRSINALAATLGTVSVIAALSMFIALAVAVYGLFGPDTNSQVGSIVPASPPSATSTPPKISDRVAPSAPQAPTGDQVNAKQVEPVAAVKQAAVLYEEDPSDPNGKQYSGTVTWQAESASPAPGVTPDVVVRAALEIPERRMSLSMAFRRNTDQTLSATHVFELRFNVPSEPPHGEISKIQGLALKQAEKVRGTLLAGQSTKVTPSYFLVTLSPGQPDMQRNLKLLKELSWFDIMFLYSNGNRAILAIEKGTPGERAFAQAFAAWGQ